MLHCVRHIAGLDDVLDDNGCAKIIVLHILLIVTEGAVPTTFAQIVQFLVKNVCRQDNATKITNLGINVLHVHDRRVSPRATIGLT